MEFQKQSKLMAEVARVGQSLVDKLNALPYTQGSKIMGIRASGVYQSTSEQVSMYVNIGHTELASTLDKLDAILDEAMIPEKLANFKEFKLHSKSVDFSRYIGEPGNTDISVYLEWRTDGVPIKEGPK